MAAVGNRRSGLERAITREDDEEGEDDEEIEDEKEESEQRGGVMPMGRDRSQSPSRELAISGDGPPRDGRGGPTPPKKSRGTAALVLGIPLEVVSPFHGYDADFVQPVPSARYRRLKRNAASEVDLGFWERDSKAYRKAMQCVVTQSDLVVAVWDGIPRGSEGGTWQAIEFARALGLPVVHIDVTNRVTKLHNHGPAAQHPREVARAVRERCVRDV